MADLTIEIIIELATTARLAAEQREQLMAKQNGIALIAALLGLMLLTILGLSLSFNAITELGISQNHHSAVQALAAAQEGLSRAKEYIRSQGLDFDEALRMNPVVPNYGEKTIPLPGTYAYRYPISLDSARRLKVFVHTNGSEDPIARLGTKDGRGIITRGQLYPDLYPNSNEYMMRPAAEIRGSSGAREDLIISYFAVRVTNNLSREEIDRGGGPFTDRDNKILVRSVGLARTFSSGSAAGNSIGVVEALLRRDMTSKISSPVIVDGPRVLVQGFTSNSFLFDGFNHRIRFKDPNGKLTPNLANQDIDTIFREGNGSRVPNHGAADPWTDGFGLATIDATNSGGALNDIRQIIEANRTQDQLIGRPGVAVQVPNNSGPGSGRFSSTVTSLYDITNEIQTPGSPTYNEDAIRNLLNPDNLSGFMTDLKAAADLVLTGPVHIGGSNANLGTVDSPRITFVDGDLDISGSGRGVGILAVTGNLKYRGSFEFIGVILVVGKGSIDFAGVNDGVIGGMLVANIQSGAFGPVSVSFKGNSNIYYSGDAINFAINRLPFETLGFREVRSEYERAILNNSIP